MNKTLQLVFSTGEGRTAVMSLADPVEPVVAQDVEDVMDLIILKDRKEGFYHGGHGTLDHQPGEPQRNYPWGTKSPLFKASYEVDKQRVDTHSGRSRFHEAEGSSVWHP